MVAQLIEAYDEYIKLLTEELNSIVSFASVHGWKTSNYEAGVKCREKIAKLKNLTQTTEPQI